MNVDASSGSYAVLFCTALFGALVWVSVTGRDRWPFSCYPMFSIKMDDRHLSILRVALDQGDRGMTWWKPEFHRLTRTYDNAFRQVMGPPHTAENHETISPQQRALFAWIASGLSEEERSHTEAIVLIRRRLQRDSNGTYVLHEQQVLRLTTAHLSGSQ